MSDHSDLIARLRRRVTVVAVDKSPEGRTDIYGPDRLCAQAADALEAMQEQFHALGQKAAKAVIAYNCAIACPKGVVPVDEFYDPGIAQRMEADMERVRKASEKQP